MGCFVCASTYGRSPLKLGLSLTYSWELLDDAKIPVWWLTFSFQCRPRGNSPKSSTVALPQQSDDAVILSSTTPNRGFSNPNLSTSTEASHRSSRPLRANRTGKRILLETMLDDIGRSLYYKSKIENFFNHIQFAYWPQLRSVIKLASTSKCSCNCLFDLDEVPVESNSDDSFKAVFKCKKGKCDLLIAIPPSWATKDESMKRRNAENYCKTVLAVLYCSIYDDRRLRSV